MWHFPVQFQLTRVVTDIKRDDLEFAASLFFMTSLIMLWQRKLVVILQNHECQHNDIKENF